MRFKVDENLHPDVATLLRDAGHDALTVWDQDLAVVRRLVPLFTTLPLPGRLWVVTEQEVRVRPGERGDSTDL